MSTHTRDSSRHSVAVAVAVAVADPPVTGRWQLLVSSTLLLLWILFLAWVALAG